MILIPRFSDLEPFTVTTNPVSVQGEIRAVLRDLMGRPVYDSGWFSNLITNYGMDQLSQASFWGVSGIATVAVVGEGTTPPAYTDRYLDQIIKTGPTVDYAGTSNPGSRIYYTNTPPGEYGVSIQTSARFGAGVCTGTLTEVGFGGGQSGTLYYCFMRQLFGTPIVKGVDNILDIYYRLSAYNNLSDVTGVTPSIEGVTYNYLIRPYWFTESGPSYSANPMGQGGEAESLNASDGYGSDYVMGATPFILSTGTKHGGTGIGAYNVSTVDSGYVAGDFWVNVGASMGVDTTFLNNQWKGLEMNIYPGNVIFRISFSSTIDSTGIFKDNERTAYLIFRQQFARRAGS